MAVVGIEDLRNLDSVDKLAEIFRKLDYEYVAMPISTRGWREGIVESILNKDIELLAKHKDFHIIRCKLAELRLGEERPIITKLLREHPYSLIIFSNRDFTNWHFVNIKYDDESTNRRLFRRIVIGPNERLHTAAQRINMLEVIDEKTFPLELQIKHDDAFDVEKVTKDFYISILRRFMELVGGEVVIGSHRESYPGCLELPHINDHSKRQEFVTRLIGRILFCWFLKKKKSLQGRPLITEDLLSIESLERHFDYYHTILEPLFFQQLNTPMNKRKEQYRDSDIPFLNGGLFQPHRDDFYEPNELDVSRYADLVSIPDKWFKALFGALERYNFTIDESTPLDVELSIDPEILGRIFENLLAEINPETGESARKSTASYYTPRPIVEYMVDESIRNYLLDRAGVDLEDTRTLLSYEDGLPPLTEQQKSSVVDALGGLKIIDPACGSGAFPMGILQKIVLVLQKVDPDCKRWLQSQIPNVSLRKEAENRLEERNLNYVRKLGVVQNNIYGVDIQPMAVEIAKLRFFLSLIVDRDVDDTRENRGVQPLPNLEFKFVCANSLIGLPQLDKASSFGESRKDIDKLKRLRNEYFISYGEERKQVEKEFRQAQKRMFERASEWSVGSKQALTLSTWKPFISGETARFFDPDWMFGVSDGFDIVIANPPYNATLCNSLRKFYKSVYQSVKSGRVDTAAIFVERAKHLGHKTCYVTYILPYRLFSRKRNHGQFQIYVLSSYSMNQILYLGTNIGFTTNDEFMILILNNKNVATNIVKVFLKPDIKTVPLDTSKMKVIEQRIWKEREEINLNLLVFDQNLLDKIQKRSIVLQKICHVKDGIVPFIREKLISQTRKDDRYVKFIGIAGNYKLDRYSLRYDELYLCYDINEAKKHISDIKELRKVQLREKGIFLNRKIITRQNSVALKGTIDEEKLFTSNSIHSTFLRAESMNKYSLEYILALLNSKTLNYYHNSLRLKGTDLHPQILISGLKMLPIRDISLADQKPFISLVHKILALTGDEDYFQGSTKQVKVKELECQIDQKVYKLYSLTEEEISLVEQKA